MKKLFLILLLAGLGPILRAQDEPRPATNETTNAVVVTNVTTDASAVSTNDVSDGWGDPNGDDSVRVGTDVTIPEDKTVPELVVVRGNATIDGHVRKDVVIVLGNATVNGKVDGDVIVILGQLTLGPKAVVGRDVNVLFGKLDRAPGAKIRGSYRQVDKADVPGVAPFLAWVNHGLLYMRPLPPNVKWVWVLAGIFLVVNLLLLALFPRPIQACVDTVESRPVTAFFTGLLAKLLLIPVFLLLIVTGVGILLVPFLILAIFGAYLIGKVAVYRYVGQQIGRQSGAVSMQKAAMELIVGTLIVYLIYMVPVLGFLAWGFLGVFGFGAVVMASFASMRREVPKAPAPGPLPPAAAVPVSPLVPPSPAAPGVPVSPLTSAMAAGAAPAPTGALPPLVPPLAIPEMDATLLPRAGFWVRFIATFLDMFIFVLFIKVFLVFTPILWLAYHIGMWTWKGTTVGGIILGIKVVRVDGSPVDFPVALVRGLAAIFSAMVFFVGFFWAGWTREKRSWHDRIAGTMMVKVPKEMSLI